MEDKIVIARDEIHKSYVNHWEKQGPWLFTPHIAVMESSTSEASRYGIRYPLVVQQVAMENHHLSR